jgi:hypothetical protein
VRCVDGVTRAAGGKGTKPGLPIISTTSASCAWSSRF